MGSIPWNALLFFTLYLQLIGMSDFSASMLVSLFFGAVALGNLLGGWVGDRAASRFPNGGRIAVTQFSVFIGIPLSWLLVKVHTHSLAGYVIIIFAFPNVVFLLSCLCCGFLSKHQCLLLQALLHSYALCACLGCNKQRNNNSPQRVYLNLTRTSCARQIYTPKGGSPKHGYALLDYAASHVFGADRMPCSTVRAHPRNHRALKTLRSTQPWAFSSSRDCCDLCFCV